MEETEIIEPVKDTMFSEFSSKKGSNDHSYMLMRINKGKSREKLNIYNPYRKQICYSYQFRFVIVWAEARCKL